LFSSQVTVLDWSGSVEHEEHHFYITMFSPLFVLSQALYGLFGGVMYTVVYPVVELFLLKICEIFVEIHRSILRALKKFLNIAKFAMLPFLSWFLYYLHPYLPLLMYLLIGYSIKVLVHWAEEQEQRELRFLLREPPDGWLQGRVIIKPSTRKFHRNPCIRTQGLITDDISSFTQVPLFRSCTSLIESVIFLAFQLSDASSRKMQAIAVATFVKSINGGDSITLQLTDRIQEAFGDNVETQADFMEYVKMGKDNHQRFKDLCDSPGMQKINKFLMFALCSGLFARAGLSLTTAGYSRIEAASAKRKFSSTVGFIDSLLAMSLFLCTAGYQAYQGMSVEHILHSPDAYGEYYDRVEIYCQDYARYSATNVAAGVEHTNLAARLATLLKEFKDIEAVMFKMTAAEKKVVLSVRARLLLIKAELYSQKICQSTRPAPFALLVHGESSIGKSVFTDILFAHYGQIRSLPVESEYKYVRSPCAEFWDGFDPKMWCLVLDDIAWAHTKGATPDMSVLELLHLVNNVPYVTNQASIEKKGNYPFLGQLIIGTTNTKDLNADAYFAYPAAARRRFPYIFNLQPKPEFRNEFGGLKVPPEEFGRYPDFWDITVEEVSARGRKTITTELFRTNEIGVFLAWYTKTIQAFDEKQAQAVKGTDSILKAPYCPKCLLPQMFCGCPSESSDTQDLPSAFGTPPDQILQYSINENFYSSDSDSDNDCMGEPWLFNPDSIPADEIELDEEGMSYFPLRRKPKANEDLAPKRDVRCLHNVSLSGWCEYCDPCMGCGEIGICHCDDDSAPETKPLPRYCKKCKRVAAWCDCYEAETQSLIAPLCYIGFGSLLYGIFGSMFRKMCISTVTYNMDIAFLVLKLRFLGWRDRQRDAMMLVGRNIQTNVVKVPFIFVILAASIVAGTAMKFLMSSGSLQGNIIPLTRERKDYYYSETSEITTFQGSEKAKCMNIEDLSKRVEHNVLYAEAFGTKHTVVCRLVGVGEHYYITNNHSLPEGIDGISILMGVDKNGISMKSDCAVSEKDIVRDIAKDIAMIRLMTVPPRKSIVDYFLDNQPTGHSEGHYVDRSQTGRIDRYPMKHIRYESVKAKNLTFPLNCATSPIAAETYNGQCGMPLVAMCGQSKGILGIHSVGIIDNGRARAGATIVLKSVLLSMISELGEPPITWENPVLNSEKKTRELGSLHPKSVFRYIEDGAATIYGSFKGYRPTPKSQVCNTPIREAINKRGIDTTHTKPDMASFRPWRIAALDMCDPVTQLDPGRVRECGDAYLAHVRSKLPSGAIKMLQRYDEFDALNGAEGIAFVDSVKRSTSAGAPFGESKKKHLLKEEPQRGLSDPVKLAPEMSRRVKNVRNSYNQGIAYSPVFTAHLKDEAVSAKKAALGKTRVFCGAPFDWSLVVRELFLSHVRLIQNFKFDFECGVGTVAPSTEWSDMYDHITKHGEDKIIAGDYKAYDKRMPPGMIMEAFRILIELAKESGNFTKEDILSMQCAAQDTSYPLVDFNGDLVKFWGSNPSGHPLTVIINSIVNSLYMRYTFIECGYDVADFSSGVSLMTYGDDNIMSASDYFPNFNHTTISESLANVGITYTMADKESASIPYINISEASFLKRGWLWNEAEKTHTAPLDETSIEKMLCVYVKSKTITASEQISEIIRSAQREWWHYGEEIFEEKN